MGEFYKGNLNTDRKESLRLPKKQQEWLIGDFNQFKGCVRRTGLLELKYWKVKKGEEDKHKAKVQKSVGEITIILQGKIKGFIGEKIVTLGRNDYVYIRPGVVNDLIVKVIEMGKEGVIGLTIKAPCDTKDGIKIPKILKPDKGLNYVKKAFY